MPLNRTVLALVVTTLFCLGQARAQERTIRVGVPAGPLVQLVQTLAPVFQTQTGIAVTATELNPAAPLSAADADAALVPSRFAERLQPTGRAPSRIIFFGDVILVGSRAEMARVRGLKDIRTALRWIAAARGTLHVQQRRAGHARAGAVAVGEHRRQRSDQLDLVPRRPGR